MAQSFRIETLDRSGRWYLTPGSRSIYDLRIRNDSKNAVDCSLVVEDPTTGVSVEPNVFALRGHEVRTVTVTFAPEVTSVRSHRVLLSLHADDDGRLLATFEHPLVATGGTDCSVAMALKGAIVEAGELRGFEMTCSVRSQSEARSTFQVSLSPHPSFTLPELPALALEPGQVGEVVVPIRWNRGVKDDNGWNHPAIFELAVPVSNGRRTSRMRWELIESKLEPFLKNGAAGTNGTAAVAAQPQVVKAEPPAAPPTMNPQPVVAAPEKIQPAVAPVAGPQPAPPATPQPVAAAAKNPQTVASSAQQSVSAPTEQKQPESKAISAGPQKTATVAAATTKMPAATASATTTAGSARTAQPAQSITAKTPVAPLMLNGFVERLMLAAPVDARPAATPAVNGTSTISRVEVAKKSEEAKPPTNVPVAAAQSNVIELPLFPVGKQDDVAQKPAPAAKAPIPAAAATSAPNAKPAPTVQPTPTLQPAPTVQPASAPQWKIVSAAESISAAAAQASPTPVAQPSAAPAPAAHASAEPAPQAASASAPVAQTPAPAAPPAPTPAAATTTNSNSTIQTPPQPVPSGPAPKLTPYSAAKWDANGEVAAPAQTLTPVRPPATAQPVVEKPVDLIAPQASTSVSQATKVLRERQILEARVQRRPRPGLIIGGLAAVAIIVGLFIFKPAAQPHALSTAPVAITPPVVVANPPHVAGPAVVHARVAVKPATIAKPKAIATQTPVPAATPKAATPAPATAAPATPRPGAQRPAVVATRPRPAPQHVARYGRLYQPESGSVVALGGIEAYYGPRGRAVRVLWNAAEQASANVSLIDDHGSTVNSAYVRGARQSVILYLPRGYRGGLTVQVSSIGRLGERVAQTTSLPPFGN